MDNVLVTIKKIFFTMIILPSMLLMSCSTHVVVISDHPPALIEKLPYKIGLVLDSAFTDYSFTREKDDEKIIISLGESQSELFDQIFSSMFQKLSIFSTKPLSSEMLSDLYVSVTVEDLQLSLPYETSVNVFEIWIQYKLQISDSQHSNICGWTISSYGRTQTRFLESQEKALNQATNAALRDAGVQIATRFSQVPEVQEYLEKKGYKK